MGSADERVGMQADCMTPGELAAYRMSVRHTLLRTTAEGGAPLMYQFSNKCLEDAGGVMSLLIVPFLLNARTGMALG